MSRKTDKVFQFKVSLQEVKPPIWRRIQVPSNYTFWDLHVAIQDSMGWQDYHLHEFRLVKPSTGRHERIGIPGEELWDNDSCLPGWEVRIATYFTKEKDAADYEYDFGDTWVHRVVLEKILPRDKKADYPLCVGGKRACPPEDCGGVSGYEDFLTILGDPKHEQHQGMLEWAGGPFDSERFKPSEVRFASPQKRWKAAFQGM